MSKLSWSTAGSRLFEAGVDRGVLYVDGQPAVPWNGLISVDENPSGGEVRAYYIDGVKYVNVLSGEEFEATITAYAYPPEFAQCDGTLQIRPGLFVKHQGRRSFGLSYTTKMGNDTDGLEHGQKIHIVYNALASPSVQSNSTIEETVDPTSFSWNLTTRPMAMSGYMPSAHIVIDSRFTLPEALAEIEDTLYGSDSTTPGLPSYSDLIDIFDSYGDLVVIDNGDGTFTISAPTTILQRPDENTFELTTDAVVVIGDGTFTVTS